MGEVFTASEIPSRTEGILKCFVRFETEIFICVQIFFFSFNRRDDKHMLICSFVVLFLIFYREFRVGNTRFTISYLFCLQVVLIIFRVVFLKTLTFEHEFY